MNLERLHVAGFGALRDRAFDFAPGINLVLGANEAGKTTLQAALAAALYGLYDGRRSPREADRLLERYRPWGGGPYALTLDLLLDDGIPLALHRDFNLRRATRTSVVDRRSGRVRNGDYAQGRHGFVGVAETHLGLDAAAFRGCAIVAQGELGLGGATTALCEALGKVVASAGAESCAEAIARLEEARTRLGAGPTARQTPLALARQRVTTLVQERERSARLRAQQGALVERRDALAVELGARERLLASWQDEEGRRQLAALRRQAATAGRLRDEAARLMACAAKSRMAAPTPAILDRARRLRDHELEASEVRRVAADAEPARRAAALRRQRLVETLAALPADPALTSDRLMELPLLAAALDAAQRAEDEAQRMLRAGGAASAAAEPPFVAPLVARVAPLAVAVLAAAGAWHSLPPPAALALGVSVALGIFLALRARDGRASAEIRGVRDSLRAAAEAAERRRQAAERRLAGALAEAGLPASGTDAQRRVRDLVATETERRRLTGELAAASAELARAGLPAERLSAVELDLRREEVALGAELDALGIPPGDLDERVATLDAWCAAAEEERKRRDRLAQLDVERELVLQGRTEEDLAGAIERLERDFAHVEPDGDMACVAGDDLAARICDLQRDVERLRAELARLDGELASMLRDVRDLAEVGEELDRATGELAGLEEVHAALTLARQELLLAQEEVHQDFAPRLAGLIRPAFHALTAARYRDLFVDATSLEVRIQPGTRAEPVPVEQLSRGTAEQVLLLLRLAMVDLLSGTDGRIPVFLDEPFAHCDLARATTLLDTLEQVARQRQVFVFTCHRWLERLLTERAQSPRVLRLDGVDPD